MKTEIGLYGLAKCEHCGIFFNGALAVPDCGDDPWKCPSCFKALSDRSFGLRSFRGGSKKRVAWLGPGGEWTEVLPEKDFELGGFIVRVPKHP